MEVFPFDNTNQEMRNAYDLIAKTNKSFFLTGRAGTGKTTFLRQVQSCVEKNFVVLAPSGVAAINAGGQTIHSFFGLDLGVQGPLSIGRITANHIEVAKNVDTIIIDEVSMVRCDIIDAVERMLRYCRHSSLPFGGVQMVFVGDLFQLPPIAKKEEKELLRKIYGSDNCYFFQARCIRNATLPKIELKKIYRQSDARFINLLEHFRTGNVSFGDLREINSRVMASPSALEEDAMRITLTAYRGDAAAINDAKLGDLHGEAFTYKAEYEGTVDKLKDVVDDTLILKEGAQVMFLRNDRLGRWANGTIGRVASLDENGVTVSLENGEEVEVEKQTWEAFEYEYVESSKTCQPTVVGSVTQYPLRLAWAITIHKSQSLTFDKVDIDMGRGAFTCGQAYVALSRARSFAGLRLVSPLGYNSVRVSRDILSFASTYNDEQTITKEITIGQAVRDYENAGDLDGVAQLLFDMCDREAHLGHLGTAYELLNRALSYVADDDCLFGRQWRPISNSSVEGVVLNAAGLLYSGKSDDCIRLLSSVVSASPEFFNGLYLMARALEFKEEWDTVERLYNQMIEVFNETTGNGLDSPAFRKLKYRVAVLNESHYGQSGVEVMANLIDENPGYASYHIQLRRMFLKREDTYRSDSEETNALISLMLNFAVSEEDYIQALNAERGGKTDVWKQYLGCLETVSRFFVKIDSEKREQEG